ncbi:MAG: DUF5132 domain-containing protein [Candidatus Xenobia bacterium]
MDLLEDVLEGVAGGAGWAVGIAAALIYAPTASRGLRPLTKRVMQGYMTVSERVKASMAEGVESLQDLYAEAKSEYAGEKAQETARPVRRATGRPKVRRGRRRVAAAG